MYRVDLYLTSSSGSKFDKELVRGYLISNDDKGVTLCTNINGDGRVFYPTHRVLEMRMNEVPR